MQLSRDQFALFVVVLVERLVLDLLLPGQLRAPHIGETPGEPLRQEIAQQFLAGFLLIQQGRHVAIRHQIDVQRLAVLPIG